MDYKFLNKVVDQIVSETMFDYDRKVVVTPLSRYKRIINDKISG